MIYLAFDIETNGPSPYTNELIAMGMVATDKDYNELGRLEEYCQPEGGRFIPNAYGGTTNQWPDPTGSNDPSKRNATDVHGILWEQAKDFQQPVDLYRAIWRFISGLPEGPITLVFHSSSKFDLSYLMMKTQIHAPPLYMMLNRRCSHYIADDLSEGEKQIRYDDTMSMARQYIKMSKLGANEAIRLNMIISKNRGYLEKDRKTPAKPEQITKWKNALAQAENDLVLSSDEKHVEFTGWSLDKITKALGIKHSHHSAISDAEVLVPAHKFLSGHL